MLALYLAGVLQSLLLIAIQFCQTLLLSEYLLLS